MFQHALDAQVYGVLIFGGKFCGLRVEVFIFLATGDGANQLVVCFVSHGVQQGLSGFEVIVSARTRDARSLGNGDNRNRIDAFFYD